MTNFFDPHRQYDPKYDVRDWTTLVERVRRSPSGALWPLLGARRAGKTWALQALAQTLPNAQYSEVRGDPLPEVQENTRLVLLDELGEHIFREESSTQDRRNHASIDALLLWCSNQKKQGRIVVAAVTPAEWRALLDHPKKQCFVLRRELQRALESLEDHQVLALARHTPESRGVAEQLLREHADWCRNPFLLTLLLDVICGQRRTARSLAFKEAMRRADEDFEYVAKVFDEGLDADQRDALRAASRRRGPPDDVRTLLVWSGLLQGGPESRIADPILADHLPPPIRIHHISDLHFGSKTAERVDVKDTGPHGRVLGTGVGQGPVRNDYLAHLEARHASERPHLLVVSGDLAEWGLDEEFAAARAWLERAEALLADHPDLLPDEPRVLLVGGNHDVDWNGARGEEGLRDRHVPMAKAFGERWPRPRLELSPSDPSRSAHVHYRGGIQLALLGSSEYGGQIDDAIVAMADELRAKALSDKTAETLARYSRIDPGVVHAKDLERLLAHSWVEPVRIAVLHHPVTALPDSTEVAPYAGLVNAGKVKDALFKKGFCLVLHGHAHTPWIGTESWPNRHGNRTLTIVSAATLGSRETFKDHGFNEIRIVREGQKRSIEIEGYCHEGQGFEPSGNLHELAVPSTIDDSRR